MHAQQTCYPHLRETLDPRFAGLSDQEIEGVFESAFGEGVTPAEYEDFFSGLGQAFSSVARDVGRFAQQAAPVVATAAQGALQGAAAGSSLGPYGALGGALLGATGAALQGHGRGTARDVGRLVSGAVGTAGALTGRGGIGGVGAGLGAHAGGGRQASPAAGQLLALLQRPEVQQALLALASGRNPVLPAGPGQVPAPASAFAGLLGALAREAEQDLADAEEGASLPVYLLDSTGGLAVDPSDPTERAARLLQLLGPEEVGHGTDEDLGWDSEWAEDDADWGVVAPVYDLQGQP